MKNKIYNIKTFWGYKNGCAIFRQLTVKIYLAVWYRHAAFFFHFIVYITCKCNLKLIINQIKE